jgi:hypothetical protein
VNAQKGAAQIWVVSFALGLLSGVSISSALCFLFPAFFAGLASPPGHLAGLEEEMQSLFVMSGILTVLCTLFFRWFLQVRSDKKASNNGWWPEKRS